MGLFLPWKRYVEKSQKITSHRDHVLFAFCFWSVKPYGAEGIVLMILIQLRILMVPTVNLERSLFQSEYLKADFWPRFIAFVNHLKFPVSNEVTLQIAKILENRSMFFSPNVHATDTCYSTIYHAFYADKLLKKFLNISFNNLINWSP